MTTRRRLIVMRHAKAEASAATDQQRVLTDRGRRDALRAGAYLADSRVVPDHALVSSAARAVGTWEAVAEGAASAARVDVNDEMYSAGPEDILRMLRGVPAEASVVMVVGHNPTVAYLARLLDSGDGEPGPRRALAEGYPTSALTVFEVDVPWAELDPGSGRVVDFHAVG